MTSSRESKGEYQMWEETRDRNSTPPSRELRPFGLSQNRDHSGDGSASLGASVKLSGEITGSGDLYIDGEVKGRIELSGHCVTVGPQGRVQADVSARNLIVLGHLKGKLCVAEKTDVRATGTLEGDLATARLSIEDGAVLHATIDVVQLVQDVKESNQVSAAKRQPAEPSSRSDVSSDRAIPAELQPAAN
jgi:cytoskeletal protein CcmA (bactofilin family)